MGPRTKSGLAQRRCRCCQWLCEEETKERTEQAGGRNFGNNQGTNNDNVRNVYNSLLGNQHLPFSEDMGGSSGTESSQGGSHANQHIPQVPLLVSHDDFNKDIPDTELDDGGVEKKRKMGAIVINDKQLMNMDESNAVNHFFGVGPGYQVHQDQ